MLACLLNDGVTLEELFPAIIPFTNFMSCLEKQSYLNLKYGNAIFEVSWNKEWFYIKFFHSIHIKKLNLSKKNHEKIYCFLKSNPKWKNGQIQYKKRNFSSQKWKVFTIHLCTFLYDIWHIRISYKTHTNRKILEFKLFLFQILCLSRYYLFMCNFNLFKNNKNNTKQEK